MTFSYRIDDITAEGDTLRVDYTLALNKADLSPGKDGDRKDYVMIPLEDLQTASTVEAASLLIHGQIETAAAPFSRNIDWRKQLAPALIGQIVDIK